MILAGLSPVCDQAGAQTPPPHTLPGARRPLPPAPAARQCRGADGSDCRGLRARAGPRHPSGGGVPGVAAPALLQPLAGERGRCGLRVNEDGRGPARPKPPAPLGRPARPPTVFRRPGPRSHPSSVIRLPAGAGPAGPAHLRPTALLAFGVRTYGRAGLGRPAYSNSRRRQLTRSKYGGPGPLSAASRCPSGRGLPWERRRVPTAPLGRAWRSAAVPGAAADALRAHRCGSAPVPAPSALAAPSCPPSAGIGWRARGAVLLEPVGRDWRRGHRGAAGGIQSRPTAAAHLRQVA